MDCPEAKKGKGIVACPPDDSLVEIFSCLQAKPLFRFKCVSKTWCDLIADRLRCRKFPFPQTLQGFFSSGGVENYGDFVDLSGRPVPLVDPSFSFLTKLPEIKKIVLLDSCNGLVLFGHRQVSDSHDFLGYIVCNPATEEWVSVPVPFHTQDHQDYCPRTYLIFDPVISAHFQLIELRFEDLSLEIKDVYTFSSVTGAWRQEHEGAPSRTDVGIVACHFDGMLHVVVHQLYLSSQYQPDLPCEDKHMILAVGGEGRPFRTLHWPKKDRGCIYFIGQSQGHLHCVSGFSTLDSQMTELSIWVLEDYDAEKWVLRNNVSLTQLFTTTSGCFIGYWRVVGIHPDRGLVIFADYWNQRLISYDMDKKEVHAVCSLPHAYAHTIIPYVPYFAQSAAFPKNL